MASADGEECRRREDAAIRVEQRLLDFIAQYEKDEVTKRFWMDAMENRFKPIEDTFKSLRNPFRVLIWSVSAIMAYPLYTAGKVIVEHMRSYFK